jgi:hypothetical protein
MLDTGISRTQSDLNVRTENDTAADADADDDIDDDDTLNLFIQDKKRKSKRDFEPEEESEELNSTLEKLCAFDFEKPSENRNLLFHVLEDMSGNSIANEFMRRYDRGEIDLVPPSQEKAEPFRSSGAKIKRNAPCPCGSGKKYKNCCMKEE